MLDNLKIKAEILFVILGLFWGVILIFINPPFQAPDEDDHLFKMWGILNGTSTFRVLDGHKGQLLPYNLVIFSLNYRSMKFDFDVKTSKQEILNTSKIPLNKDKETFYAQTPTSYTVFSYLPTIFVLFILKALNVPPLFMVYILRFCCLLTYLAIMYQAIKIIPYRKWLLFILALIPTNLYIASAINTDCLVISSAFLLIAYTLYLKFDENIHKISNKQILLWACLYTFICILKYLYFPLIILYFLLPKNKFNNPDSYFKYFVFILVINIIYIFLFLYSTVILSSLGVDYYHKDSNSIFNRIHFIITHPIEYVIGLIGTPIISIISYFKSFISQFGWKPFAINMSDVFLFYFLIFMLMFYETKSFCLTLKNKLLILFSIIVIFIIVLTSVAIIYGVFPIMLGFQGRYAGPFIPLIFLLFDSSKILLNKRIILISSLIILQYLYFNVCYVIINHYYRY